MPRKNENAGPREMREGKKSLYQIPERDTNSPLLRIKNKDRIYLLLNPVSEAPVEGKEYMNHRRSVIKTTAEQIVRQHREEIKKLTPYPVTIHPPKISWWQKVNWGVVFEWGCWTLVAICLIYLGIFIFAPIAVKLGVLNDALKVK